ncbi:MAG: MGMT family protein, partial [Spirochaetales bacterium]|nr:MGMT family protein [Spirochaetales bacterium]
MIKLLGELERGKEERKSYSLSPFLSGPQRRILTAAAAIPIGYVSTYGNIADAAGSEARAVGRAMATNPLYPIVPCHRVVGADMSLVGYGG